MITKFKHDLKGDLDEIWYSGYNMCWNRPAAGLLHKESGKELGYFSIPPTRSSNCSWAQKMAVVAKAASMFGKYTDSLIYDGYVDSAKPDTSKDLVIMRNVFKSGCSRRREKALGVSVGFPGFTGIGLQGHCM